MGAFYLFVLFKKLLLNILNIFFSKIEAPSPQKKKAVLITGGSSGIGLELAKLFYKDNYNLVLVARNIKQLKEAKKTILKEKSKNEEFMNKVFVLSSDLSNLDSPKQIFQQIKELGFEIDILVNNAGFGQYKEFDTSSLSVNSEMINCNCNSLMQLTQLFLPKMIENRKGAILNVSSIVGFIPVCKYAVYSATKSFVNSFTRVLRSELKKKGIIITNLSPGSTSTNFGSRSGSSNAKRIKMKAKDVSKEAYEGLFKNKKLIVPGLSNKLMIKLPKNLVLFITSMKISKKMKKIE